MWRLPRGRLPLAHPFLFASYASLSLISANLGETGGLSGRLVAIALLLAGLVYLAIWLFTREWTRSGLIASAAVLLFFSYGHVLNVLGTLLPAVNLAGPILMLWLGIFAGCVYWVRRAAAVPSQLTTGLTVAAAVLNLFQLYPIATYSGRQVTLQEAAAEYAVPIELGAASQMDQARPDIYYIILDAYGRADVLQSVYSYDNSDFIEGLSRRGFQVDSQAVANYTHSELSMASSLNLRHLNDLPAHLRASGLPVDEGSIRGAAGELIQLSSLRLALEQQGYTSVSFDSGYARTRMDRAQIFVQSPEVEVVSTWQLGMEFLLLDTTLGRGVVDLLGPELSPHARLFEAHRARVLFTLAHLADYARAEGDFFVFAHVISPHVPFVFDADGDPVATSDPYTLLDARGGDPANIQLYADQLHYLNTVVLSAIDRILSESQDPPIIVLQADHGSKVYSEPDPPLELRMRLHLPILNAVHAPGVDLYPGMTPVNTFRTILGARFGVGLELKPDQSYLLDQIDGDWQFVDVCEVYRDCESLKAASDG